MKNILILNQPVGDYTVKNLGYTEIIKIGKVLNLNDSYYSKIISQKRKGELELILKWLQKYDCTHFTMENIEIKQGVYTDDDGFAVIYELPNLIGLLTQLREVQIQINKIKKLPDSFCDLINLRVLYAHSNEITELPNSFGKLINLKFINLAWNRISELPDSFCNLINLQELDIKSNKLKKLPKDFKKLVSLTNLDISYNPDFDYFTDLSYVKTLRKF